MSDPKRLLDEGADDLGAALLRAGRTLDTAQARERKAAALLAAAAAAAGAAAGAEAGVDAAAAAGAEAGAGATAVNGALTATVAKWLALGLLAAAVLGGAAFQALAPTEERITAAPALSAYASGIPAADAAATASASASAPAPASTSATSREETPAAAVAPKDALSPRTSEERARPPASPVKPEAERESPEASLAEEVAALQKARDALAAARPARALTFLDVYMRHFPKGRLALEAEVLRIEALAHSGNASAATDRAEQFLAAHPSSPYANRVRALARLGDASKEDPPSNP